MNLTPENSCLILDLDTTVYTADSEVLMKQRGIVGEGETVQSALERTVNSIIDLDNQFESTAVHKDRFQNDLVNFVNRGVIVFGTPVLTNVGREDAITAACTVLPLEVTEGKVNLQKFRADSHDALSNAVGTGYDLSELSNPSLALSELNEALEVINQRLISNHKRPVASMATLRADHPDILNFVRAKREADFSKWRFNISVFVTDDLFRAAEKQEPWNLLDADGTPVTQISAMDLLQEIADSAHYCGEPGILFKDRIDRDNPTPQWEYKSTAPCAEVAMASGEACQFSYINVAKLVKEDGSFDFGSFSDAAAVLTRVLDASVEQTIINKNTLDLPLVAQKRRIGIGITGFADLLVSMGINYDDPLVPLFASQISEVLDYSSKIMSVELAKQRGAFPAFQESRYQDAAWVERKKIHTTGIVPADEWHALFRDIGTFGIRHASTTSMPPTGTSSAIVGSSKSLEPHFSLINSVGKPHDVVYKALESISDDLLDRALGALSLDAIGILPDDILKEIPYLQTARQISPDAHLRAQAGFQTFLDEALSKTINLPRETAVEEVTDILWLAYRGSLKGVTVFRDSCLGDRQSEKSA